MSQFTAGVDGATDVVSHVCPPGLAVTVYLVIVRLPLSLDALQATFATPVLVSVRVLTVPMTPVGAPGVAAAVVRSIPLDAELNALRYEPLSAFTLKV